MIHHTLIPQSDMPQIDAIQSDTDCALECIGTISVSVKYSNLAWSVLLHNLKAFIMNNKSCNKKLTPQPSIPSHLAPHVHNLALPFD